MLNVDEKTSTHRLDCSVVSLKFFILLGVRVRRWPGMWGAIGKVIVGIFATVGVITTIVFGAGCVLVKTGRLRPITLEFTE